MLTPEIKFESLLLNNMSQDTACSVKETQDASTVLTVLVLVSVSCSLFNNAFSVSQDYIALMASLLPLHNFYSILIHLPSSSEAGET
jgi:hypothetical protein